MEEQVRKQVAKKEQKAKKHIEHLQLLSQAVKTATEVYDSTHIFN